ncbi:MAG: hypothetical protein PVI86_15655, partial [Phycisphaerae bacterium]
MSYATGYGRPDCNENGIPDTCDIASGLDRDCNFNGILDRCDIADGTSDDCDGNDVPDQCQPRVPRVIHVDAAAEGRDDGTSWGDAFTDLADGLEFFCDGDEAWVASAGEHPYTPDRGTGDREATFDLVSGVGLYGGFLGNAHPHGGETARAQREPARYVTVLSGDLSGDDVGSGGSQSDNSAVVVSVADADEGPV